jgi:thiamine monophosphate synthase
MDVARATQAAECGAAGVAVISAITAATSPETAIAVLKDAIDRPVGRTRQYQHIALPQSTLSS